MLRRIPVALLACLASHDAWALSLSDGDPLIGDVGAAYSHPVGADANPANAAYVDRTMIFFEPELFASESLQTRYPGFDPVEDDNQGLGSFLSKPSFVYKVNPRLGISAFALPPGVGTTINKSRIPIIVLGQQSYVDLNATGTLGGMGGLTVGYKLTNHIGIGFNLSYLAVALKAKLTPTGGSTELVDITGNITSTTANVGVRLDLIPGKFAIGAAIGLVNQSSQTLNVTSPLLGSGLGGGTGGAGGAAAGGAAGSGGASSGGLNPLSSILFGVALGVGERGHIYADGLYTRVDKSLQGFSIVELKQKPEDLHDTMGIRLGTIIRMTDSGNAMAGFRYEPASLGEGSRGEGGEIGFGTQDLVQVYTGFQDLLPFYQIGFGVQFGISPKAIPRPKGSKEPLRGFYEWTVEAGVVYKTASLGIDQNGELPGAYLYKKTSIPVAVAYKF